VRLKPRSGFWASTLVVGLFIAAFARPAVHLARTTLSDRSDRPPPPPGSLDDASGLSQTAVREIFEIPVDPTAAETQLAELLRRARQERTPVSIAGARHSMGGHALRKDGIVLDMRPFRAMRLDEARNLLSVQAGALRSDSLR
jgi:FAD/FMN-containing dehydrogenase